MKYNYSDSCFESKINIAALYNEMSKNIESYKLLNGINEYIEKWYKVMIDSFNSEKDKEFTFRGLEQYYTEIIIPNCEIRIHFCITDAKKHATNYTMQSIPLSSFSTFDNGEATVRYTEIRNNSNYDYSNCSDPIILIEYPMDGFSYLVIDGNHRITSFSDRNFQDNVNVILLPLQDTLRIINSEFEKAVYLFLYEGGHIEECINDSATNYYNRKFNLPL